MKLLKWVEVSPGYLKAEPIKIDINFIDICEGRFWGLYNFNYSFRISIHQRSSPTKGWTHQLLLDGMHVYCKSVDEAKDIAERMYGRIVQAFTKQLPQLNLPRRKSVKNKKTKLLTTLRERGIVGRIWFSQVKNMGGWMFSFEGSDPQLLGSNYEQALDFINSGTLDFYKGIK